MAERLSPFYLELLQYIEQDVEKRKIEEGFDPAYDRPFREFQEALTKILHSDSPMTEKPVLDVINQYNFLIGSRGAMHLELQLLHALSLKDFAEMGLKGFFPKIYRGIPRLYAKNNPSLSKVKSTFSHLPSLKRAAVEKAIYSLYQCCEKPKGRLVVFTWVIFDGLGDWIASQEIVQLLQKAFEEIEIQHIALLPKQFQSQVSSESAQVIFYEGQDDLSLFEQKHWKLFAQANVILQTPTFYPHTKALIERVREVNPIVRWEHVGEYGFAESSWFHPKSGHYSMGLHFLEKGILTRKIQTNGFAALSNHLLSQWLFGMQNPGPLEIEQYRKTHYFYLGYLKTLAGGKVYLHALLKSLERDDRPVDICMPDLEWFVRYCQERKKEQLPCLEQDFGVKHIEVWHQEGIYIEKIADRGKIVRLLAPGTLTHTDFQALLTASEEFVAVRGDQSFSEVVCANKIFFYDSSPHARYFVKDLAALAESRISSHRGTLTCIRQMVLSALSQLSEEEEGEWIDELYFQRSEFNWFEASQQIGMALQDPDTLAGFKKFNRILSEELSCNHFFEHLIHRAFVHAKDPAVAYLEEKEMNLFAMQKQSFKQLVQHVQLLLLEKRR